MEEILKIINEQLKIDAQRIDFYIRENRKLTDENIQLKAKIEELEGRNDA